MRSESTQQIGKRTNKLNNHVLANAVMAALAATSAPALAATSTWDGGGSDGNWNTAANWAGDTAPLASDLLQFGDTANLLTNNDFAVNTPFGGISFLAGAGSFTLGGNGILLTGDIVNNSGVAQTINFTPVNVTANTNLTYAAGGLVLDGATSNVSVSAGGSLALGQVTFGLAPLSTNVSTLNLNNSVSASGLTVQTSSAGTNTINIAAGQTFTIGGNVYLGVPSTVSGQGNIPTNVAFTGGGNLSATADNFYVGLGNQNFTNNDRNVARVDMTGLANFSYTGSGNFGVGWMTRPDGQLRLTPGTNTIVADVVGVGVSGRTGTTSSPNNSGTIARLFLGTGTNIVHADTINVGTIKGSGSLEWQGGTGSVALRAQDGLGRANIMIGHQTSATGSGSISSVLLAGHHADVLANNITVGRVSGSNSGGAGGGELTFDTGTLDVNTFELGANAGGTNANGTFGNFTMGGGTLTVNTAFIIGNDTNASTAGKTAGTFTLNNGTATINAPISRVIEAAGENAGDLSEIHLNGGTLDMTGHNIGSTAAPLTTINLTAGNLNNAARISARAINVSGTTITGAPTFVLPAGGTLSSSLPTLTLASGGGIEGGGATASAINGNVAASSGSQIAPGVTGVPGTLQFNNDLSLAGGSNLQFSLSEALASGNDQINVSGALSLSGTVNVSIGTLGLGAQVGNTYTLFNYTGALTGNETNLSVGSGGTRKTFTVLPTNTTPNTIQVSVGGSAALNLTWVGNVNDEWDLIGDSNWQAPGPVAEKFFNQDTVTFDDTSANPNAAQLVGDLAPAAVNVIANRNYTFAGAGAITGPTTLTKDGSGTLTITNANTYTGATTITSGVLAIGNGGSLGTSAITNNATLRFTRTDTSTFSNPISGGGGVEHAGSGVTTLAAGSDYFGQTSISAGTVIVQDETSLGNIGGSAVVIASGATLDLSGGTGTNNIDFSTKLIQVAGGGVGGNGAIINSGNNQQNAFERVLLTGDTLINANGVPPTNGRIDIRLAAAGFGDLDLAGFTLTKTGGGQFSLVNPHVTAGNIVVNQGVMAIEAGTSMDNSGGTITYNDGTVAQWFSLDGLVSRAMVFNGNVTTGNADDSESIVASNLTINGTLTDVVRSGESTNVTTTTFSGNIGGVGSLAKDSGDTLLVLAGSGNTYSGGTTNNSGTLRLTGTGTVLGTPGHVVNNASLQVYGNATLGNVSGSGTTTIGDGNAFAVSANHVRQGSLTVADNATLSINANSTAAGVSKVTTLAIGATSGKLNLNDNKLITSDAAGTWDGVSAYTDVAGLVDAGRGTAGNALWDGTRGITTSDTRAINNGDLVSIGVAKVGNIRAVADTETTTFAGQTVLGSDTLVMATWGGDANLDGKINIDDYGRIDGNVGQSGSVFGWDKGDFNYDGKINIDDYGIIDGNINRQGVVFATGHSSAAAVEGVAAVPEPAGLMIIALAATSLLTRRRRVHG